uniref:Osteoclast-stimulating factor 1 n=1 Tax=Parascaris univalens TaxID=6257 RepID=A0A915B1B2_PARUN
MANVAPPKPAPKPGQVVVYRALYDYTAREAREMSFNEGDLLYVSDSGRDSDWLTARCGGQTVLSAEYIDYPLHDAAKRGNEQLVTECLNNAVRLFFIVANSLDKSGSTALHWASYAGHTSIIRILVAVPNMCISAQNKLGDTALHAAAWKGHAECVRILLERGANTSIRNNERKRPIDIAADAECRTLIHLAMSSISQLHSVDHEYLSESDAEP